MSTETKPESQESGESPTLGALALALSKAQGAMASAKKDSSNPHFKSSYADLASVWDAIRAPLSDNELAVVQRITTRRGDDGVYITSTLMHSSGEKMWDTCRMPVAQMTAHGIGAATTYGRRYSLMGLVGIAPDDDDDGNRDSLPFQGPPQQGKKENRPVSNRQAAPKPETKKVEPMKPAESGSAATDESALKVRKLRLWASFNKAGGKKDDWAPWLAQCLGEPRTSESLSLADCVRLETELANGLSLIPEPPADPEEPINTPMMRFHALAGEFGMTSTALQTRAMVVVGKTAGFTHAEIDKLHAAIKVVGK